MRGHVPTRLACARAGRRSARIRPPTFSFILFILRYIIIIICWQEERKKKESAARAKGNKAAAVAAAAAAAAAAGGFVHKTRAANKCASLRRWRPSNDGRARVCVC